MTVGMRSLIAVLGLVLAGGVLGGEILSPDGSTKGMIVGLGVGLAAAAVLRE